MAQLLSFEESAVARLRERLGAAVEANADLIAFARGHWGAVASINAAVLATIESASVEELLGAITARWPQILGIDFVAILLVADGEAVRADHDGIERVEPAFADLLIAGLSQVEMRSVETGHPIFGLSVSHRVNAEALVRIGGADPSLRGLLALGQSGRLEVESGPGGELLRHLADVIAASIRRLAKPR